MDAPAPAAPKVRRAALAFIFVTVLVDVMAFGLIIPVLPHLLKKVTGGEIADATLWHGLFATGFMAMQFLAQPIQGALSDRFGLWLCFHPCAQEDYLAMVRGYCDAGGIEIDDAQLRAEAIEWQATRGARSGRVAWQFYCDLAGRMGRAV